MFPYETLHNEDMTNTNHANCTNTIGYMVVKIDEEGDTMNWMHMIRLEHAMEIMQAQDVPFKVMAVIKDKLNGTEIARADVAWNEEEAERRQMVFWETAMFKAGGVVEG